MRRYGKAFNNKARAQTKLAAYPPRKRWVLMLEPTAFDAQLQHRRSGPHTYLVRGGFLMLEPTSPGLWQSALLAAAIRYGKINNVRDGYEHDVSAEQARTSKTHLLRGGYAGRFVFAVGWSIRNPPLTRWVCRTLRPRSTLEHQDPPLTRVYVIDSPSCRDYLVSSWRTI